MPACSVQLAACLESDREHSWAFVPGVLVLLSAIATYDSVPKGYNFLEQLMGEKNFLKVSSRNI